MKPKEIDRIESAIRHIQTSTDIDPWAAGIAVEAMRKQIDHIAGSGKKVKQTFCSNCRNEAPEGKINSDCLMCMHLYGVHTQEANKEAAYEFINFPKRDLFEPRKGIADSGKKVERTAETAQKTSSCAHENDLIFRKAAIEALARMMPRSYTPDGSHPADEEIFRAQEVFADCIEALEILPSAQPEIIRCKDCKHRHVENMVWTCPFGLPGGENFFCGYGTEPYKGE